MSFSLSWKGRHNEYRPEAVSHSGAGGDLEDRLVVALKHAVGSILHSLGPDHPARDVQVSVSGHATDAAEIAGTSAAISLQVMPPPEQATEAASQDPQATSPTDATGTASESGTEPAGAVGSGASPEPDPSADPAPPEGADPAASSSPGSTPAPPSPGQGA